MAQLKNLRKQFEQQLDCDITFVFPKKEDEKDGKNDPEVAQSLGMPNMYIGAHKFIIRANSEELKNITQDNYVEMGNTDDIASFKVCLSLMYNAQDIPDSLTVQSLPKVWYLAFKYGMSFVMQALVQFLKKNLTPEICLGVLWKCFDKQTAKMLEDTDKKTEQSDCKHLVDSCFQLFTSNTKECCTSVPGYFGMTLEQCGLDFYDALYSKLIAQSNSSYSYQPNQYGSYQPNQYGWNSLNTGSRLDKDGILQVPENSPMHALVELMKKSWSKKGKSVADLVADILDWNILDCTKKGWEKRMKPVYEWSLSGVAQASRSACVKNSPAFFINGYSHYMAAHFHPDDPGQNGVILHRSGAPGNCPQYLRFVLNVNGTGSSTPTEHFSKYSGRWGITGQLLPCAQGDNITIRCYALSSALCEVALVVLKENFKDIFRDKPAGFDKLLDKYNSEDLVSSDVFHEIFQFVGKAAGTATVEALFQSLNQQKTLQQQVHNLLLSQSELQQQLQKHQQQLQEQQKDKF